LGLELLKVYKDAQSALEEGQDDNINLTLGKEWSNPFGVTVSREAVNQCSCSMKWACKLNTCEPMQFGVTAKDRR
jgi:hypothetical protein